MVHSVVLLLVLVGAGPLASQIPTALLAGILIKVGLDIIDWGISIKSSSTFAEDRECDVWSPFNDSFLGFDMGCTCWSIHSKYAYYRFDY